MKIEIKGKTYSGSVNIYDRLTLPQVELVEEALDAKPKASSKKQIDEKGKTRTVLVYNRTDIDKPRLPALLACVEAWDISGFPSPLTVENFPMTPRGETNDMIDKIFDGIRQVYSGEIDLPNE